MCRWGRSGQLGKARQLQPRNRSKLVSQMLVQIIRSYTYRQNLTGVGCSYLLRSPEDTICRWGRRGRLSKAHQLRPRNRILGGGFSSSQLQRSYSDPAFAASPGWMGIRTWDLLVVGRVLYPWALSPLPVLRTYLN